MALSQEAIRPLDDPAWLDDVIGDARVVAIGESAHYHAEFYDLRRRLLRRLVERHGFTGYAMESGFVEGWRVDDWVRGRAGGPGDAELADGLTSLMGLWTQMRAHLDWMRRHNGTAARPVGFYGIDLPGSLASLLPGLDAVIGYLAAADPGYQVDPGLRETAASFAATSPFSMGAAVVAYGESKAAERDALTAGLAALAVRFAARRLDYVRATTADDYRRAVRTLAVTSTLDAMYREMSRGDRHAMMLARDAALADTVEWVLGRTDRIVVGTHNGHLLRCPGTMPGMPPLTTMGMHLADRLGAGYLAVGTTSGTGRMLNTEADFYAGKLFTDMAAPRPGSLDALMAASHDAPFAVDLRRLSAADAAAVRDVSDQRFGAYYSDLNPLDAYHVVVHLPYVTEAEPDDAAIARAPEEVQVAFGKYKTVVTR